MKIERILWERVAVECSCNPEHNEEFSNATVTVQPQVNGVEIREEGAPRKGRSALYARAKLKALTSDSLVFEACWWSAPVKGDAVFVPVTITATF